ncbi:MAG TPA: roadblock/LC7 domain-containing protein [Blastocatellia bacterium]|nr:roadblock/LC7 domain-containing protein [Blastocatellia bacterium]
MGFTETLTEIANRIEGCAAVVILGIDGIPIERHVRDVDTSLDLETVAAEFTTLVRRSIRTASDTELGEMREMVFATDSMSFLLRPITSEYFLLLALKQGGNIGRARFELRKAQLAMEAEFAI